MEDAARKPSPLDPLRLAAVRRLWCKISRRPGASRWQAARGGLSRPIFSQNRRIMIPILVLGIVLGFTVLAPKVRIKYGSGALWLLAVAASVLTALVFAFLQPTYSPEVGSFQDLFFWSALIAAGAGFASLALLVPRWRNRPQRGRDMGKSRACGGGLVAERGDWHTDRVCGNPTDNVPASVALTATPGDFETGRGPTS